MGRKLVSVPSDWNHPTNSKGEHVRVVGIMDYKPSPFAGQECNSSQWYYNGGEFPIPISPIFDNREEAFQWFNEYRERSIRESRRLHRQLIVKALMALVRSP